MKNRFSFRARIRSFRYAFQGLFLLIQSQHNARIHLVAAIGVVCLGIFWQFSRFEWCIIVIAIFIVWITEAFNSALEFLADHVSPEYAPLVGKAKDLAAAAVLLAAFAAIIIGLLIIGPHLFSMLNGL